MNPAPDSAPRPGLSIPLRWTLLAAVTAGCLALLSLLEGSPAAVTAEPTPLAMGTQPATADPIHDPAARLGATLAPLAGLAAQELGLGEGTALSVLDVQVGSQAFRAGLRVHDVITAIASPVALGTAAGPTTSATWEALSAALDERAAGGALDFFVRRDGRTCIVHVQLQALAETTSNLAEALRASQTACA